jgi:uncharacterized protein YlbG (UPF0298 family)
MKIQASLQYIEAVNINRNLKGDRYGNVLYWSRRTQYLFQSGNHGVEMIE